MTDNEVSIVSRDYWFKVVDMLQHNWAIIDASDRDAIVWFIKDASGVFDSLLASSSEAAGALRHNGFERYAEDEEIQRFIRPPQPPFSQENPCWRADLFKWQVLAPLMP